MFSRLHKDSNPSCLRQQSVLVPSTLKWMIDHLERIEAVEKGLIRGGEVYRRINYYKLEAKRKRGPEMSWKFPSIEKPACLGSNTYIVIAVMKLTRLQWVLKVRQKSFMQKGSFTNLITTESRLCLDILSPNLNTYNGFDRITIEDICYGIIFYIEKLFLFF